MEILSLNSAALLQLLFCASHATVGGRGETKRRVGVREKYVSSPAHAGGISTGACRNLRICAHKTWQRTRTPVFVLFKSNLSLEGVLLLIMSYWTCDAGLRRSASLAAILDSGIHSASSLMVVHVLTSLLIAT